MAPMTTFVRCILAAVLSAFSIQARCLPPHADPATPAPPATPATPATDPKPAEANKEGNDNPALDADAGDKDAAGGAEAGKLKNYSRPTGRFPAETTLNVSLLKRGATGCEATLFREHVGGPLLTAVLPKVIDTSLVMLSSALQAASGEDSKTRHYLGLTTGYAFNYEPKTGDRFWRPENGCLHVTSSHQTDGKPTFDAFLPIQVSMDGTAVAFDLSSLDYRGMLSKGRKVKEMTFSIEMTDPAGKSSSVATFDGPFVPAPERFAVRDGVKPSSGWIPLPTVDDTVKALVTDYEKRCGERAAAAKSYIDAEIAATEADKNLDDAQKKDKIDKLRLLSIPQEKSLCGRQVSQTTYYQPGHGWSQNQETGLGALETRLKTQQPINFNVVITETRDVNKFLYTLSQKLAGDQKEIRDALMGIVDPATRKANAEAEATNSRQKENTRLINASAFEQKLAAFHEAVRVYQRKSELVRLAHADLVQARERSEAKPDNKQLRDAVKTASDELETAETEKSSAMAQALTAKQEALAAAITADITITGNHPLKRFPS
jgi:hypothetical protein